MPPDHPAMHIPCWRTSEPIQEAVLSVVTSMLGISREQMEQKAHYPWGIHTMVQLEITYPAGQLKA